MTVTKWNFEAPVTDSASPTFFTNDRGWDVTSLNDGGYLITWIDRTPATDVAFGQRFNANGNPVGSAFEIGASVTGASKSEVVVTSLADGGFVAGFVIDTQAGDVWFERYDTAGAVVQTTKFDTFANANAEQHIGIDRFGTGFLLSTFDADSSNNDNYVWQRDASGNAVNWSGATAPFTGQSYLGVNYDANTGTQRSANVASIDNDGRFVSVWVDENDSSYKYRVFSSNGSAVTASTLLRDVDSTGEMDFPPQVAGLANGGFVAVWQESVEAGTADQSSFSVQARMFNRDGVATSGIVQVNALFNGLQARPDVVATTDGGFFVSWDDSVSGNRNISGQMFDALGNRVGAQITINSSTASSDFDSRLALLSDGRIVAIWANTSTGMINQQILDPRDGVVLGTDDNNALTGNELYNDEISGLGGADTINGLGGNDRLIGGDGTDTLNGGAGNDFLDGGAEADVLNGEDGINLLVGGAGADQLIGGGDRDTASYITAGTGVLINLNNVALNTGDAAGDTYSGIDVFVGSNLADEFVGSNVSDEFWGSYGNDIIRGNGGNDSLYGGWGLDNLEGGAGADHLDGGQERDIATYANAGAGLRASLANTAVNTGDATGDTYVSIEGLSGSSFGDDLIGSANGDFLYGAGGADVLWGQGGNDELYGEAGNDWLIGGSGADKLDGGTEFDTVRYSFAAAAVHADLKDAWTGTGDAAGDTYFNVEGLVGSDYSDELLGDEANNEIWGDYGDDQIWGRGGTDQLSGGNGLDTFYFTTGWGNDTIIDYKVGGAEKLNFSGVAGLTSFGQLAVTVGGAGTTVGFGGNTVFLQGIASFTAADCVF